jgi:hypothetical protein
LGGAYACAARLVNDARVAPRDLRQLDVGAPQRTILWLLLE